MPRNNLRALKLVAAFVALSGPAFSQEDKLAFDGSLFFSPQEQQALKAALALRPPENLAISGDPHEMAQIPESQPSWSISRLHLSALIFYEPQKWSLWFGDRQVRKGNVPPFLTDLKVFANHIDVSVIPRPGAAPIPVRLRPNQTFLVDRRRIIEGGRVTN